MAYKSNAVDVNTKKFVHEITKRNLSLSGLAKELGYSAHYFSNRVNESQREMSDTFKLPPIVVRVLFESYNIRPESILPDKEPEPKSAQTVVEGATITPDALYALIYKAVYEAMKLALRGE